jgi:hypothetical protein
MTKHLESNYIDTIALSLDEDVYGANGDLDELEIKQNLIEKIHAHTDYQYVANGMMPVWAAADLIRSVWEQKDRDCVERPERQKFKPKVVARDVPSNTDQPDGPGAA